RRRITFIGGCAHHMQLHVLHHLLRHHLHHRHALLHHLMLHLELPDFAREVALRALLPLRCPTLHRFPHRRHVLVHALHVLAHQAAALFGIFCCADRLHLLTHLPHSLLHC